MQQIAFRAMGCQMAATVDSPLAQAADRLRRVPEWFERWERHLSRFRPDSELCRLNRSGGRARRVSQTLWAVCQAALAAARESDGLVVPTLLDALEAAGYDRGFDQLESSAGEDPCPTAAAGLGRAYTARAALRGQPDAWRQIERDLARRTVRLPAGVRLDVGGIAKGWAADSAARRLGGFASALVDAGGDVAASGPPAGLPGWPVAVADPAEPERRLALLCLPRGGVATSGRDYRRWRHDGRWQHHLIDPRTGRPAETDVLSATAIAPSAGEAEVAAKVALILGSRQGLAWLDARPRLAGLLVCDDGWVLASRRLRGYLWT